MVKEYERAVYKGYADFKYSGSNKNILIKNAWAGNFLSKNGIDSFLNGKNDCHIRVVTELFAVSYISFYQEWKEYTGSRLWITYGKIKNDAIGLIKRISKYMSENANVDRTAKLIDNISKKGGINYNKGKVEEFDDKNLYRIEQLAKIFRRKM